MTHNYSPGMYDISEEEYFALPYISNSDLKLLRRSPAHYYAARLDPKRVEKEPTDALIAGKMLHTAILEPQLFDERYIVLPADAPRRPTPAQINAKNPSPETVHSVAWWSAWNAQAEGRVLVTSENKIKYMAAAKAVRGHPDLSGFLESGHAEKTFIDVHEETGIVRRSRIDWITTIGNSTVIIDFKSAEDARPYPFSRACYNYDYFEQAAYYCSVVKGSGYADPELFLFGVFEKEPPYGLMLYQATEEAMLRATLSYENSLQIAKRCIDSNNWPCYSTDIQPVDYPSWAKEPA